MVSASIQLVQELADGNGKFLGLLEKGEVPSILNDQNSNDDCRLHDLPPKLSAFYASIHPPVGGESRPGREELSVGKWNMCSTLDYIRNHLGCQ